MVDNKLNVVIMVQGGWWADSKLNVVIMFRVDGGQTAS